VNLDQRAPSETLVGVFVERPEPQPEGTARRAMGQKEGEVYIFCFYEDGVVRLSFAAQANATQEALATYGHGSLTRPVDGFAYQGTYRRVGTRLWFDFVSTDRTLNFDWDDKGYYEEDRHIAEYSGTIAQDRLTLDWTSRWEAETFVAPPPERGRIQCERVTA
jgi:hypothetical protein